MFQNTKTAKQPRSHENSKGINICLWIVLPWLHREEHLSDTGFFFCSLRTPPTKNQTIQKNAQKQQQKKTCANPAIYFKHLHFKKDTFPPSQKRVLKKNKQTFHQIPRCTSSGPSSFSNTSGAIHRHVPTPAVIASRVTPVECDEVRDKPKSATLAKGSCVAERNGFAKRMLLLFKSWMLVVIFFVWQNKLWAKKKLAPMKNDGKQQKCVSISKAVQ